MNLRHLAAGAMAMALAAAGAPVLAQDAQGGAQAPAASSGQNTSVTAGATVYGSDGVAVGTVEKVEGGNAVVTTGTATAALPLDKFGTSDKGPTIGFTKQQFETAANAGKQQTARAGEESAAPVSAALTPGAELYSSDGVLLGKVKTVAANGDAVVELPTGAFTVTKEQVALNGDKLTFQATKADIDAAVAKAKAG